MAAGAFWGPVPESGRATGHNGDVARTYRLGTARRATNIVVAALLRHGIGGKSSYLLTTTGRHTGVSRTTPVILVESGSDRWLVAPYGDVGWVHNVRASRRATLRRGKSVEVVLAEELGPEDAGPVLRSYLRDVRVTAPYFDAKATDPVQRFVAEARRHPVFKLSTDPSPGWRRATSKRR
ncbi:MAG: nitroreductase family deazaflavin-dependent oxidoreductase [Acidimicrobiales bacterium]